MEILFENVYTDTEESMLEMYRLDTKGRRWIFEAIFAAYAVFFLFIILAAGKPLYWVVFLFCIAYFAYYLFLPQIMTRRYFKHMKQHYDGSIPETRVICTEEDIAVWFGQDCGHMPYDKITKVHFGKNIIRLYAGKVLRATLLQNAFTKGTKEEFVEFLRVNCPNLITKLPDGKR